MGQGSFGLDWSKIYLHQRSTIGGRDNWITDEFRPALRVIDCTAPEFKNEVIILLDAGTKEHMAQTAAYG